MLIILFFRFLTFKYKYAKIDIVSHSDAEWGQNAANRKFSAENITFMGKSCISWFSNKETEIRFFF